MTVRTPPETERHLLNRFSYGISPALAAQSRTAGDPLAWFEQQLQPDQIDDAAAAQVAGWFPRVWGDPGAMEAADKAGGPQGWEISADFARWTLMRRLISKRQVHEVMTEFWSNLLHVPSPETKSWPWRPRYDAVVRQYALGRFDDMLVACVLHPAMGCYLDNARSTAKTPNENLGRELLELHTVGVGGYTETEVRNSALILTGWLVDVFGTYAAAYSPADHWTGQVKVLGFTDANANPDGRDVATRYVRYLANHPTTARRVAQRLATRFVSDAPSAALVSDLAGVFTASGTDIPTTLRALVRHPEFSASVGAKVRTPVEDAVNTCRVLGVKAQSPTGDASFANAMLGQVASMGQRPFDWGRPDGFPDAGEAWAGVTRVLNAFDIHNNLAGGNYPSRDVTYRSDASWLPRLPATLGQVVDSISRRLVARPASVALLDAVSARLELSLSYQVRTPGDLPSWRMRPLLGTVLDSPEHMTR